MSTGKLVLIVTENEGLRALLCAAVEMRGYHAIAAQRAASATRVLAMPDAEECYFTALIDTAIPVGYGDAIRSGGFTKPIGVVNGALALEDELALDLYNVHWDVKGRSWEAQKQEVDEFLDLVEVGWPEPIHAKKVARAA